MNDEAEWLFEEDEWENQTRNTGRRIPPPRRGLPAWAWVLISLGIFVLLGCGGIFCWIAYIGTVGPETSVYTGSQVPARFVNIMKEVGALEEGENLHYFYSEALTDIRDSFCFVSDKKVAVYSQEHSVPLTVAKFDQIEDLELAHEDALFTDSVIHLKLKDGTPISFPVSNEAGGDKRFFDAIKSAVAKAK